MPSWKVSMRDSMSNQTSHFGIMGGLYNRKVSGRSSTNRVTSRLTIPTGAAPGLKYMKMHNLLSKNPQGSGGVGKVVKSKPCNCETLGKLEVKEDIYLGGINPPKHCAAGTSSVAGGPCTPCAAGTFSDATHSLCTPCPAGYFSAAGATACIPCTQAAIKIGLCTLGVDSYVHSHEYGAIAHTHPELEPSTPTLDSVLSIGGSQEHQYQDACHKLFVQMDPSMPGAFQDPNHNAYLGFVRVSPSPRISSALHVRPSSTQGTEAALGWLDVGATASLCDGQGCLLMYGDETQSNLVLYDDSANSIYTYDANKGWAEWGNNAPLNKWVYAACAECSPGYFPNTPASDLSSLQLHFLSKEASGPPPSAYGNTYGCIICPSGSTCDGISKPKQCAAGTSSEGGVGVSGCNTCKPGTFAPAGTASILYPSPGPPSCPSCPAGYFSKAGAAACTPCPAGASSVVCNVDTCPGCILCAAGTSSLKGGLCIDCAAGTSSGAGETSCSPCAAGTSSVKGGMCKQCAAGTSSLAGATSCLPCAPGTYSKAGGPCTQNTCTCKNGIAATGTTCKTSSAICGSCNSGYTLSGGTCVSTPPSSLMCPNGKAPFGVPKIFCCSGAPYDGTVPSCSGKKTNGEPNNDHMCYTHVPDGQVAADVNCGGTVPPCTHVHYQTTEHTHIGASHASTGRKDSIESIIGPSGVCNKFFVQMDSKNQGVFGTGGEHGMKDTALGFVKGDAARSSYAGVRIARGPPEEATVEYGFVFGGNTEDNCNFASTSPGCSLQRLPVSPPEDLANKGLQIYNNDNKVIYYYNPISTGAGGDAGPGWHTDDDINNAVWVDNYIAAMCSECQVGYFPNAPTNFVGEVNNIFKSTAAGGWYPRPPADAGFPANINQLYGNTYGCTVCPLRSSCDGINLPKQCAAGQTAGACRCRCTDCSAGTFTSEAGGPCIECSAGTSSEAGAAACIDCSAGTFSKAGAAACIDCSAGTSSAKGAGGCYDCSAGTFSKVAGAACIDCSAGWISKSRGPCTACSAGWSSKQGGVACFSCPEGQTSVAGGECKSCPPGTSSVDGDPCTQNTCSCPNGTAATSAKCTTDGATICVSCTSGYTLSGETCVGGPHLKCPGGEDPFGDPPVFCCSGAPYDSTVPSCSGRSQLGYLNNDNMCYTYIPTGQVEDITCGGTVPQCGHVHYQTESLTTHTH